MIAVDTGFEGLVQLFVPNHDWSTLARLLIQIDIDPDSNKSENKYVASNEFADSSSSSQNVFEKVKDLTKNWDDRSE